jgi:hypothetical protein
MPSSSVMNFANLSKLSGERLRELAETAPSDMDELTGARNERSRAPELL